MDQDQTPNGSGQAKKEKPNVLLGVTGSVATIKISEVLKLLLKFANVKVIATTAAQHFIKRSDIPREARPLLKDVGEWHLWKKKGDPVLHIELRKWADLFVIAPLSANTLAKVAQGLSDNLLTSVFRAWDFSSKPVVIAPAMNTFMWESTFTKMHLDLLGKIGVRVIPTVSKLLACGDTGFGAMAEPETISTYCEDVLEQMPSKMLDGCSQPPLQK